MPQTLTDPLLTIARANRRPKRSAAVLAEQIERDICTEGHSVGNNLGSYEELCKRYSTSGPVLRQAVRLLAADGIGFMRRGPNGGFIVSNLPAQAASQAMAVYFDLAAVNVRDVIYVASVLETFAITQGVERGTARWMEEALGICEDTSGKPIQSLIDLRVHIAELADNPFLTIVSRALATAAIGSLEAHTASLPRDWPARHRAIIEALASGDVAQAIDGSRAFFRLLGETPGLRVSIPTSVTEKARASNAEQLTRLILAEIQAKDLAPGYRLGSEQALMKRYKASRDLLRQAVAILERYSIATVRSGPGGGILVGALSPDRSIVSCARYAQAAGISEIHTAPLREPLLLAALDILPVPLAARTRERLVRLRKATLSSTGSEKLLNAVELKLLVIAESRSVVIDFLFRLIAGLTSSRPPHPVPRNIMNEAIDIFDSRFMTSLLCGDIAMARLAIREQERIWRSIANRTASGETATAERLDTLSVAKRFKRDRFAADAGDTGEFSGPREQ